MLLGVYKVTSMYKRGPPPLFTICYSVSLGEFNSASVHSALSDGQNGNPPKQSILRRGKRKDILYCTSVLVGSLAARLLSLATSYHIM